MTRQEINEQLSSRLNTPAWEKAKKSLVGQELISWATETIFALQSQRYALEDIYNNVIADMSDIIRLSNSSIPTVQLADPSYIVVDFDAILNTAAHENTTFGEEFSDQVQPYSLKMVSGSTQFYYPFYHHTLTGTDNHKFGTGVKLYQGIPQLYYYEPEGTEENMQIDYAKTERYIPNRTRINFLNQTWADDGSYSNYVGLGPNILVDSVCVYIVDNGIVKLLHEADPMEIGPDDLSYKLYIDQNKNYNIVFGNGVSAKFISDTTQFYITFLRLTDLDFNSDNLKVNFENHSPLQLTTDEIAVHVYSYRSDDFSSVEKSMVDMRRKIAARSALTTVDQIRNFLKGYEEIVDAIVVAPDQATPYTIPVWVVTRDNTLTNTTYIQQALENRVSLVYDVDFLATSVHAIKITDITPVESSVNKSELLPRVRDYLAEVYSRDTITYGQKVYRDSMMYLVKEKFGVELSSIVWNHSQVFFEQETSDCYYITSEV